MKEVIREITSTLLTMFNAAIWCWALWEGEKNVVTTSKKEEGRLSGAFKFDLATI